MTDKTSRQMHDELDAVVTTNAHDMRPRWDGQKFRSPMLYHLRHHHGYDTDAALIKLTNWQLLLAHQGHHDRQAGNLDHDLNPASLLA